MSDCPPTIKRRLLSSLRPHSERSIHGHLDHIYATRLAPQLFWLYSTSSRASRYLGLYMRRLVSGPAAIALPSCSRHSTVCVSCSCLVDELCLLIERRVPRSSCPLRLVDLDSPISKHINLTPARYDQVRASDDVGEAGMVWRWHRCR